MILGRDIFTGLKIDLCFSDNTIKENGGACKGCIAPMKDITNILLSAKSHYNIFVTKNYVRADMYQTPRDVYYALTTRNTTYIR